MTGQPTPPRVVLFDVNETLSDMAPLAGRFAALGLPPHLAEVWFAGVLRDGFALTAAGAYADFREVADAVLRGLLADQGDWSGDPDRAVAQVLDGMSGLSPHPDVAEGVRALRDAGAELATLGNGSSTTAERLLSQAGVLDCFTALLDVSPVRAWKPAAAAYRYACETLGSTPEETLLVAVHPWDVDGARRAGLRAVWLHRGTAARYPAVFSPPEHVVPDLRELAPRLTGRG